MLRESTKLCQRGGGFLVTSHFTNFFTHPVNMLCALAALPIPISAHLRFTC